MPLLPLSEVSINAGSGAYKQESVTDAEPAAGDGSGRGEQGRTGRKSGQTVIGGQPVGALECSLGKHRAWKRWVPGSSCLFGGCSESVEHGASAASCSARRSGVVDLRLLPGCLQQQQRFVLWV